MPRATPRATVYERSLVRAISEAELGGGWIDHPAAPPESPEDDDATLLARAYRLSPALDIEPEVRRTLGAIGLLWPAAVLAGGVVGVSAAWAGLAGGGDPTTPQTGQLNPLWFLQITLGVHTVLLVGAVVAMALAHAAGRHPWLGAVRSGAGSIARIAGGRGGPGRRAAVATALGGRRGAWLASGLGHAAGLGFVLGAVLAVLVAAGFREQYQFFWKSTLLSDAQAVALIDTVASGPRVVGLPAPSRQEIAAARAEGGAELGQADAAEWAWMLVGALLVWGAAPRAVALGTALIGLGRADSRSGLPVPESYRIRALARERGGGVAGSDGEKGEPRPAAAPAATIADPRPEGPPAVLGYEVDGAGAWPPRGLESCVDLGLVDGAADRRTVLARLDEDSTRPRSLIAVFSRGETPAQAERDFLAEMVARAGTGAAVALDLGRSLATDRQRRDAERVAGRTALWRQAAIDAGVAPERIVEVDLRHMTGATIESLKGLAETNAGGEPRDVVRALHASLNDIDEWAARDDHSQASLSRLLERIEARFDGEPAWRRSVRAAASARDLSEVRDVVSDATRSIARLLPGWMPRHPGWMAATATLVTSGTLGAVMLAGGPIGIAAGVWPLYAAVGAALGELTGRGASAIAPEPPRDEEAAAEGARAAVLHALVLSLQGRGDERIARAIDAVLEGAPEIVAAAQVPALTAHVRDRGPRAIGGAA